MRWLTAVLLLVVFDAPPDRSYWQVDAARYVSGSDAPVINAVAVDSHDNVYVAWSASSWTLTKFDPNGSVVFSSPLDGPPADVALDTSDAAYVLVDRYPVGSITKFDARGARIYSTSVPAADSVNMSALAVDRTGSVIVGGTTPRGSPYRDEDRAPLGGTYDGFLAKLDPNGRPLFARAIGGHGRDTISGIATDATGHIYVAGTTNSIDFPATSGAFQRRPSSTDMCRFPAAFDAYIERCVDAFVMKLDPADAQVEYATFIGGAKNEDTSRIAVDRTGAAYVAGTTDSNDFPFTASGQRRRCADSPFCTTAVLTRVAPDGASLEYAVGVDGFDYTRISGLAVAADRSAVIVGATPSTAFPTKRPLQPITGGSPLLRSLDGGLNWDPVRLDGSVSAVTGLFAGAGGRPLAAVTNAGILTSNDGAQWQRRSPLPATGLTVSALDATATLLAIDTYGTNAFSSPDGGATWLPIAIPDACRGARFVVAPADKSTVYGAGFNGTCRSADGGSTWVALRFRANSLAVDPRHSNIVYARADVGVYRSVDRGETWEHMSNQPYGALYVDATSAVFIYGAAYSGLGLPILRSVNGGVTFTPAVGFPSTATVTSLTSSAARPEAMWATTYDGIYGSADGGLTWTKFAASPSHIDVLAIDALHPTALYAGTSASNTGFLAMLDADGSEFTASTYFGSVSGGVLSALALGRDG